MPPSRGCEVEQQDRKAALRRSVRDARRALPLDERHRATAAITARLRSLPELLAVRTVLAYAATSDEVDVDPAVSEFRARGVRTLYPRVHGENLDLVPVRDLLDLVDEYRGVREPRGAPADPTTVDAVLVPGVAFDLRGWRLGQGGGHYDRLLPRIGDAMRIGVAFACQLVPQVPHDPHDASIDVLVTERSVYRFERLETA
jgi:5-formyltetrahydrofolate cyclo-ligase